MIIKNYNHIISSNHFDIVHREKIDSDQTISQSSELILEQEGGEIRIKFELAAGNDIDKNDLLFIPETNFLFYRGMMEWCAFDITHKKLVRNEAATQLPYLERRGDVVIIYDDLYVECTDLRGQRIDIVPVDPPTEATEYEDRIEFESLIFGKQTLKLRK